MIWQRLLHSTTPFTRLFAARVQQAFEMAAQDLVLLLQQQIEQQRIMMERQDKRHQEQLQAILVMARKSEENEPIKTFTGGIQSFSAFDSATELWTDYWARFNTFTEANSIPEEKTAYVFLTNQTPVTYK